VQKLRKSRKKKFKKVEKMLKGKIFLILALHLCVEISANSIYRGNHGKDILKDNLQTRIDNFPLSLELIHCVCKVARKMG
jgi:hypothetical protein